MVGKAIKENTFAWGCRNVLNTPQVSSTDRINSMAYMIKSKGCSTVVNQFDALCELIESELHEHTNKCEEQTNITNSINIKEF
ncbi:MAG: hypothetical protein ACI8PW_001394 [Methylophilaceae bacterium]|jgi:hypothetical protein